MPVGLALFIMVIRKPSRKDWKTLTWLLLVIIAMVGVALLKRTSAWLQTTARQIPEEPYLALAWAGLLFAVGFWLRKRLSKTGRSAS